MLVLDLTILFIKVGLDYCLVLGQLAMLGYLRPGTICYLKPEIIVC